MIDAIGQADYNYLIQSLIPHQLMISLNYELPYTGTFFHYRGSMLNWCPIGRQSGDFARKAWVNADTESGIRSYYMKQIQNIISSREIQASVALGGSTSFDIYPLGWNKTYVLKHLSDYSSIYFVGDRCEEGGNDWHIYNKLKDISDRDTGSFATSSMSDTMKIIQTLISKLS
jgi:phosphomannomutase